MNHTNDATYQGRVLTTFELYLQLAHTAYHFANETFLRSNHITSAKFVILKLIKLNCGKITNSELANHTNTKRSNVSIIIKHMTEENLVTTEPDLTDRRVLIIKYTDKGRKLLEEAGSTASYIAETLMQGITEKQITELTKTLNLIKINLTRNR